jgi:hypothetical protein
MIGANTVLHLDEGITTTGADTLVIFSWLHKQAIWLTLWVSQETASRVTRGIATLGPMKAYLEKN